MTDRTHYCAGCKGREDIIRKLEAEVERLTLTVRKLQGHQGALEADNAQMRGALGKIVTLEDDFESNAAMTAHEWQMFHTARAALQETSHDA